MPTQKTGGRSKALILMFVSVVAALVAVGVVVKVLRVAQTEVAKARQPSSMMDAAVAARELNVGVAITEADVAIRAFDAEMVPKEGTFPTAAELVGRVPRERILPNELVREERLASSQSGEGLNALVTPGKRAMAVAVDAESGVAGFLQPGNYVDVIVTIRPEEGSAQRQWMSRLFLQGIKVLAVGKSMTSEKDATTNLPTKTAKASREKPTVTLEVDVDQAQELALATSRGDIHLILRNEIDITNVDAHGVQAGALVGRQAVGSPAAPKAAASSGPQTTGISEVVRGDVVEEIRFKSDGTKTVRTLKADKN